MIEIFERTASDLDWPFDSGYARVLCGKEWAREVKVDPFPCYAHNRDLVARTAEQVHSKFPIGILPAYYLLHFEATSRTNGHADRSWKYNEGKPRTYEPYIVLSGKRIPPHPAMTRYLVAHEYGHVVQWWIEYKRDLKDEAVSEFDREYMKMRPEAGTGYGGLKWHAEIGELIANDFRICVTGIEPEFWPHPGFEHPLKLDVVRGFWQRMVEEFAVSINGCGPAESPATYFLT